MTAPPHKPDPRQIVPSIVDALRPPGGSVAPRIAAGGGRFAWPPRMKGGDTFRDIVTERARRVFGTLIQSTHHTHRLLKAYVERLAFCLCFLGWYVFGSLMQFCGFNLRFLLRVGDEEWLLTTALPPLAVGWVTYATGCEIRLIQPGLKNKTCYRELPQHVNTPDAISCLE